jgi:DNA-binding GntR family transcriptional regulator
MASAPPSFAPTTDRERPSVSAVADDDAPAPPTVRRSSGEVVADHLRREIFAGRFRPGDRIPQEEVAGELGVSRIPVREALVILEREGRVRLELHRGAFVLPMDEASVRDNAEIFGMLYSFFAQRAAERVSPAFLGKLADLAARLRATDDPRAIFRLSEEYLDLVLEVGAAPRTAHVIRMMRSLTVGNLFDVVPSTVDAAKAGTLALIDAIRDGAPERAAQLQMDQQRAGADLVVAEFRRRGIIGDDTDDAASGADR